MELNDEQFWRALRQALELAEADEAEEMAAAERLLAETPVDAGAQMSEERIAEVVRFATAPSALELEAEAHDEGRDEGRAEPHDADHRVAPIALAPVPAPAPRLSWRRRLIAALPRPLAAAAAILLAPQFLAAATVVTVVVVTTVVLRHTTQTLSYQDAISLMMQDEQSEQTRTSSQSVVFSHLKESIQIVQVVASESSPIGSAASAVLSDLRSLLVTGAPYVPRHFPDAHLQLGDVVADTTQDLGVRQQALQKLSEQLSYGLGALQAVEQAATTPPKLKLYNTIWLGKLADTLAN